MAGESGTGSRRGGISYYTPGYSVKARLVPIVSTQSLHNVFVDNELRRVTLDCPADAEAAKHTTTDGCVALATPPNFTLLTL
jgi:hypothetical protein